MHLWHDSRAEERCSVTSPFCYMICALYDKFVMAKFVFVGAHGCILDLLSDICICICLFGELMLRACTSFTVLVGLPYIYYLVGLPYICLIMFVVWLWWRHYLKAIIPKFVFDQGSWLMTNPYLTFYSVSPLPLITLCYFPILIQCNIFYLLFLFRITSLLYLFTGLFKLSRVFFLPRQVLEGSWVMGEECN